MILYDFGWLLTFGLLNGENASQNIKLIGLLRHLLITLNIKNLGSIDFISELLVLMFLAIHEESEGLEVSKFWKSRLMRILWKRSKLCGLNKVVIIMSILDKQALIHLHPRKKDSVLLFHTPCLAPLYKSTLLETNRALIEAMLMTGSFDVIKLLNLCLGSLQQLYFKNTSCIINQKWTDNSMSNLNGYLKEVCYPSFSYVICVILQDLSFKNKLVNIDVEDCRVTV